MALAKGFSPCASASSPVLWTSLVKDSQALLGDERTTPAEEEQESVADSWGCLCISTSWAKCWDPSSRLCTPYGCGVGDSDGHQLLLPVEGR